MQASRIKSKSLLLPSPPTPLFQSGEIRTSTVPPQPLRVITAPTANLANINLTYDPESDTSSVTAFTTGLTLGLETIPQALSIHERGSIEIARDLLVRGDVNAGTGNFIGDIVATNANLLGDVVATTVYATDRLKSDGFADLFDTRVRGTLDIQGIMTVDTARCLTLTSDTAIASPLVQSQRIESPTDLDLVASLHHTVSIPNCRYNVDTSGATLITPDSIKLARVFVLNRSVILQADPSCNGIEIILFNRSNIPISIRDNRVVVFEIEPGCACRVLYLDIVGCWVRV